MQQITWQCLERLFFSPCLIADQASQSHHTFRIQLNPFPPITGINGYYLQLYSVCLLTQFIFHLLVYQYLGVTILPGDEHDPQEQCIQDSHRSRLFYFCFLDLPGSRDKGSTSDRKSGFYIGICKLRKMFGMNKSIVSSVCQEFIDRRMPDNDNAAGHGDASRQAGTANKQHSCNSRQNRFPTTQTKQQRAIVCFLCPNGKTSNRTRKFCITVQMLQFRRENCNFAESNGVKWR